MRYVLVTGANRGLGAAIAEQFRNDYLITFSKKQLEEKYIDLSVALDLSFIDIVEEKFRRVLHTLKVNGNDEIILINNAGVVGPIQKVENIHAEEMLNNYKINLLAPTLMIKTLICEYKDKNITVKILNISSGAAENAIYGWGAYCSSKAALNMISNVVNKEIDEFPITVATFRPGVIDTDMQENIRNQSKDNFKDVEYFKSLKMNNQLHAPRTVANVIYKLITSESFKSQHYNVEDYL